MKAMNVMLGTLLGLTMVGCLQSPLLSHANASAAVAPQQNNQAGNTGCDLAFSKTSLCASVTWVKQPTADDQGEFTVRFWDPAQGTEAGPYVTPADDVAVKLWMPEMGHGSSPTKVIAAIDTTGTAVPGVFDVQNIFFVMNGKWQVFIQLKKGSQVVDQVEFDYNF
jgi:YtkA-like